MQIYIRFDWLLRYLLRDRQNYQIIDGFLSELLGQSVEIKAILDSGFQGKSNHVNLLVNNPHNELFITQLRYETELDYFDRILYGASKLITQYTSQGKPYSHVRKVISISIVYFDLRYGEDYLYHGMMHFQGFHRQDTLLLTERQQRTYQCQQVSDIYPHYNLIKIEKFQNQIKTPLDEWIYFLKNGNIRENFTARGLKEAKARLAIIDQED